MKRILFVCLLFLGNLNYSFGQQPEGSTATVVSEPELLPEIAEKRIANVEVDGDGVPVPEFVALVLSKEFPEVNFVMAPEMNNEALPRIILREVTLNEIFTAIDIATKGRVHANIVNERMVSLTRGKPTPVSNTKPVCRAFSVANYLAVRPPEEIDNALRDLEDALQKCWSMLLEANPDDDFDRPNLSLHRTTKLLIVVGKPEQMAVVEQLISQLEGGAPVAELGGYAVPRKPEAPPVAPKAPAAPKAPVAPGAPVPPSTKPAGSGK